MPKGDGREIRSRFRKILKRLNQMTFMLGEYALMNRKRTMLFNSYALSKGWNTERQELEVPNGLESDTETIAM